mmetsp:Transcript_43906/g.121499  ORF Transcript_43906/g.121499 Transcript_43906/m.121499 type:complete len:231 (+) Transcript_43906:1644-2336(+)
MFEQTPSGLSTIPQKLLLKRLPDSGLHSSLPSDSDVGGISTSAALPVSTSCGDSEPRLSTDAAGGPGEPSSGESCLASTSFPSSPSRGWREEKLQRLPRTPRARAPLTVRGKFWWRPLRVCGICETVSKLLSPLATSSPPLSQFDLYSWPPSCRMCSARLTIGMLRTVCVAFMLMGMQQIITTMGITQTVARVGSNHHMGLSPSVHIWAKTTKHTVTTRQLMPRRRKKPE